MREFVFNIQRFANEGWSVNGDLMVGAGTLFFNRLNDDGTYQGWHHLGNVEEFNITTDVTTIEKNSSMNKRRELMASVVTAVAPTASLSLNEYDPTNLALGLFGKEMVETQVSRTYTNRAYRVPTVPGMIHLTDENGNGVYNVTGLTVSLGSAIPGTVKTLSGATPTEVDMPYSTILVGGSPSASGSLNVKTAFVGGGTPTDLTDIDVLYSTDGGATWITDSTLTGSTGVVTLTSGVTITVTFDADNGSVVPSALGEEYVITGPVSSLSEGTDYFVDEYLLRGGVVQIPATSRIAANTTVNVTFTVPQEDLSVINGAGAGDIQGMLKFIGDPNLGIQYVIEGWNVKVTPDGDLTGLISDDFGAYNLNVKFLADYQKHPKYPYYKVTQVGRTSTSESDTGQAYHVNGGVGLRD